MKPDAPASDWLLYLIHFFDFAPFFRTRTGAFRASGDSELSDCGGGGGGGDSGGEEEEEGN